MNSLSRIEELTQALEEKESLIRLAAERAALLLEISDAGTWEWVIDGDVLLWDRKMIDLWGYDPAQYKRNAEGFFVVEYGTFISRVQEDQRERVQTAVTEAIETRSQYNITYNVERPDGSVVSIHASGRAYPKDALRPERLLGVCIEVDCTCP